MFALLTSLALPHSFDTAGAQLEAVVLLTTGSTVCAGTHYERGKVLTAYHCVAAGGKTAVETRGGERVMAQTVHVDVAMDLAVLDAPDLTVPTLQLAPAAPPVGGKIVALGHPMASDEPAGFFAGTLRWSVVEGVVSAVGPSTLQVSAPLNPGNSGGPIVHNGRVVGVVSRRLGGQALGFAGRVDGWEPGSRRRSPVGGTVGIELGLDSYGVGIGSFSAGPKLIVAFRDRLVLEGQASVAIDARWTTVQVGDTSWTAAEAHAGLRQRIGRGSWTLFADGWGGIAHVRTLAIQEDSAVLDAEGVITPVVGGTLRLRKSGLTVGYYPLLEQINVGLVLRVPGVLQVF